MRAAAIIGCGKLLQHTSGKCGDAGRLQQQCSHLQQGPARSGTLSSSPPCFAKPSALHRKINQLYTEVREACSRRAVPLIVTSADSMSLAAQVKQLPAALQPQR